MGLFARIQDALNLARFLPKDEQSRQSLAASGGHIMQYHNEANFDVMFAKEYWTGDSRDGRLVNGDGYHYYQLTRDGKILEAFEYYEREDGTSVVSPLPEMRNVHWIEDLGFDDLEVLDVIPESEFQQVKESTFKHS
jgi:hypothetical protein